MTTGVGSVGAGLLALAAVLTVVGCWWLVRVTRPPFDWRPTRRRQPGPRAAPQDDDLIDLTALAHCAGLGLPAAVRHAAGDRPQGDVEEILTALRHRVAGPPGPQAATPGPTGQDRAPGSASAAAGLLQDEATRLRRRQLGEIRWGAQRIRWVAALPYLVCLLPASVLALVALV